MALTTNSDWPDPSSWVNALVQDLQTRFEEYESLKDHELKRNKMAAYIGCIAAHIGQLPPFHQKDLLLPIKDLLIFIDALENGSGHPWVKARNWGGTNTETTAETEVRIWVIMGVWSLIEGGYRPNQAYKYLAKAMTESGRLSRGGKPYSHRNVQRWWLAYKNGTDRRLRRVDEHITNYWAKMPCPHGALMYDCPSDSKNGRCIAWRDIAQEFASRALKVPNFRDWFISSR